MTTDTQEQLPATTDTQEQLPATTEQQDKANALVIQRRELWNHAKAMSQSSLVPGHFRGKPADCFIMADLCCRNNWPLLPTLQSTYIVHGKPGFEGKFVAALLDGSGKIAGPIDYEFDGEGEDYGCRAVVFDRALNKIIKGPKVTWAMVHAEGWDKPKGSEKSKWQTMPDLMFHYRAAAFLVRTRYPAVLMGMNTTDELADAVINVIPQGVATMEDLTGGSEKEETPPETPAASDPAADPEPAVDTEPEAASKDDQPGDSADGPGDADSLFGEFVKEIGKAVTTDDVNLLLTDAETTVSAAELAKLKTIAANMRIRLNRGRRDAERKGKS